MKIALIGLPQSGKKTLFTLLTGRAVPEGRKPGEVVEGIARIRDPRVDTLSELFEPEKTVYAENNFVLCPDADADGAARDWLTAAARCDLMCLVIRSFSSEQVYHPSGSVDPERDKTALLSELLLSDMQVIEKRIERLTKEAKAGLSSEQKLEQQTCEKCMAHLEEEKPLRDLKLEENESVSINSLDLVTVKPVLFTFNVSEDDAGKEFGPDSLSVSCLIEQEIADMEDTTEQNEYMEAMGFTSSGLDRTNAAAYDALGLMSFYTVGKDECRAWTIRKGSHAPVAGGKVHTDIQRGFIRVEVIKYDDLIEVGSEAKAKENGKLATKGKDYIIEDGDICHFLFNV